MPKSARHKTSQTNIKGHQPVAQTQAKEASDHSLPSNPHSQVADSSTRIHQLISYQQIANQGIESNIVQRKVNINDDKNLEKEADEMGAKAIQIRPKRDGLPVQKSSVNNPVVQGMYWWAPYAAALGVAGLIGLYAWWNSGKKKPPPNLTDVTFKGKHAKDDIADTIGGIPMKELEMLGINVSGTQITSPHHPDLLHTIGATGVKRSLGVESSDALMSKEGMKYDREEADRLVKAAGVKKGEGIHKTKKHSAVIGESHDSTHDKALLVEHLAQEHSGEKRTLYIEILKEMQPVIDFWQKQLLHNPQAPMPVTLSQYLSKLDQQMNLYNVSGDRGKIAVEKNPKGTYTNIVETAAKFGVRIVGMDSLHAKNMEARGEDPEHYKRAAAMNQSAFEVIKEDQKKNPSEYLVYTGHAHVSEQHYRQHPNLMGLTDRLGIPEYGKKAK